MCNVYCKCFIVYFTFVYYLFLSRPDIREPFLFSIWLGQVVTWVGKSMFLFLCWTTMVPNQRQLFIVVSDWGSYLGSLFSN
jgi:hypothetical protein